jgi:hypothetical protein
MTDIWNFPSSDWTSDRGLVGYDVEATDGRIGRIDESTLEAGRQHVVVDDEYRTVHEQYYDPYRTRV